LPVALSHVKWRTLHWALPGALGADPSLDAVRWAALRRVSQCAATAAGGRHGV